MQYYCFFACFARLSNIFFNSCIFSCTSNEVICSLTSKAVWVNASKRCCNSQISWLVTTVHFVFNVSNSCKSLWYSSSTQTTHLWRWSSSACVSKCSFTSSTSCLLKSNKLSKICFTFSNQSFSITHFLKRESFLNSVKNCPKKKAINHRLSRFIGSEDE